MIYEGSLLNVLFNLKNNLEKIYLHIYSIIIKKSH